MTGHWETDEESAQYTKAGTLRKRQKRLAGHFVELSDGRKIEIAEFAKGVVRFYMPGRFVLGEFFPGGLGGPGPTGTAIRLEPVEAPTKQPPE